MPTAPLQRGRNMRMEDQWDTYFLGYVCMHIVHQVDSVITDALVALFGNISVVILKLSAAGMSPKTRK